MKICHCGHSCARRWTTVMTSLTSTLPTQARSVISVCSNLCIRMVRMERSCRRRTDRGNVRGSNAPGMCLEMSLRTDLMTILVDDVDAIVLINRSEKGSGRAHLRQVLRGARVE